MPSDPSSCNFSDKSSLAWACHGETSCARACGKGDGLLWVARAAGPACAVHSMHCSSEELHWASRTSTRLTRVSLATADFWGVVFGLKHRKTNRKPQERALFSFLRESRVHETLVIVSQELHDRASSDPSSCAPDCVDTFPGSRC